MGFDLILILEYSPDLKKQINGYLKIKNTGYSKPVSINGRNRYSRNFFSRMVVRRFFNRFMALLWP